MTPWHTIFFYFKITALYLLVITLFLLPVWVKLKTPSVSAEILGASNQESQRIGLPVRIKIPSIDIDLPVTQGRYDQKTWDLSPVTALFAEGTNLPNKSTGNTLIYGHNTAAVFAKTDELKIGDSVIVFTNDQHIYTYKYISEVIVKPDDVSIFSYEGDPQLTLLTCNGFLDSHRRLMFFRLIEAI